MNYAIGIDFGTLSARGVLLAENGEVAAESEYLYPHGVMCEEIGQARQDGEDYLSGAVSVIRSLLKNADPSRVAVIGIDFTSCTVIPVTRDGVPLSSLPSFMNNREALVKLWKHHGAQTQAEKLSAQLSPERKKRVGGTLSCEAFFPKLAEWYENAPDVWKKADLFLEAGDFLTFRMTGRLCRSASFASYKAIWDREDGYPSFSEMDRAIPGFGTDVQAKLEGEVVPAMSVIGTVSDAFASMTGLTGNTLVMSAQIDAHASLPAIGIRGEGDALAILGTSAAVLLNSSEEHPVPDINGYAYGTMIPGLWGYEIGQASFGDHFAWAVKNIAPERYEREAEERGMNLYAYLTSLCENAKPGSSGLLALDWWNGSRAVCIDSDLSGMILGLTLKTKPEEIFGALVEATCFGLRSIFDLLADHGVSAGRILLSGGIPLKNGWLCRTLADVLGRPVTVTNCRNSAAVGSAIYAFCACGLCRDYAEAAEKFGVKEGKIYSPDPERSAIYGRLYEEYRTLTQYFHKQNHVMKRLAALRKGNQ